MYFENFKDFFPDYVDWEEVPVGLMDKKGRIQTEKIPLMLTGTGGVLAILEEGQESKAEQIRAVLERETRIRRDLYVFAVSDEDDMVQVYRDGDYCEVRLTDDVMLAFADNLELSHWKYDSCNIRGLEDMFVDHELPEVAPEDFFPKLKARELDALEEHIQEMMDAPVYDGDYRIFTDGRMEVRKTILNGKTMLSNFAPNRTCTEYFPCMDESGEDTLMTTLVGGVFGVHKFKEGRYVRGIAYALTGGAFGVGYVMDVVNTAIGEYCIQNNDYDFNDATGKVEKTTSRLYPRPVKSVKRKIVSILASVGIAVFALGCIYVPAYKAVGTAMGNLTQQTVEQQTNKIQGEFTIDKVK